MSTFQTHCDTLGWTLRMSFCLTRSFLHFLPYRFKPILAEAFSSGYTPKVGHQFAIYKCEGNGRRRMLLPSLVLQMLLTFFSITLSATVHVAADVTNREYVAASVAICYTGFLCDVTDTFLQANTHGEIRKSWWIAFWLLILMDCSLHSGADSIV